MFKRSSHYLLLVGLYVLISVFLYLDSRSAFYLENEELAYLALLVAGTLLVLLPSLVLFLIGMLRREPRANLADAPVPARRPAGVPGPGGASNSHAAAQLLQAPLCPQRAGALVRGQ
ncbi:hypothetical protein K8U54_17135 [Pseudomonas fulva]|uniref:hypothetical protein n=1 Tax=Pseudomonas fulva TaxID=47880 RepID=UPI00201E0F1A|nr:hypothetical protein [Pseudomonas fulva]UQY33436.1 hypothetical protein K8U54_17135 [Pseudomonas fulva]